jgi:hypothetical protein
LKYDRFTFFGTASIRACNHCKPVCTRVNNCQPGYPVIVRPNMKNSNDALSILKDERQFLDNGGYRSSIRSRQPLFCMETSVESRPPVFFEDSPSCPKRKYCACDPDGDCVLMSFVPAERRHEAIPCHHIPLNEKGQTIHSLRGTGTNQDIEATLRTWLLNTIRGMEESVANEAPSSEKTT